MGLSADCVEHGPQGCGHPTHIADVRKHPLGLSCHLLPPAVAQAVITSRYTTAAHAGHNKEDERSSLEFWL
eukprot:COSAG04_NODE_9901_length_822_cov_1.099585_2_plen_70_part_01